MKKFYFILPLVSAFLLTGCTKSYNSIDDYIKDMDNVRNKQNSYVMEVKQSFNDSEWYYRTYKKGEKWKTETSMNGGTSYMSTTLYDGEDVLTFSQGSPYAIATPLNELTKNSDEKTKKIATDSQNPTSVLTNWEDSLSIYKTSKEHAPKFQSNNEKKNGFKCRLITYGKNKEVCVNDKYGIAVYSKATSAGIMNPNKQMENTYNIVSIKTENISDSIFELPKGIKKMSFDTMLDNLDNMMKKLK